MKQDEGKTRWDLVPWRALEEMVKAVEFGARKYGENNWRKLDEWKPRYFAAGLRHLKAWFLGEEKDPESGLHHLAHAACCVLFSLERTLTG